MGALSKGLLLGLALNLSMGPVFFIMIGLSLTQGFKKAFNFSMGSLLSDIAFAIVLYTGTSKWFIQLIQSEHLKFTGGFLFVLFGVVYLFVRNTHSVPGKGSQPQFLKGLIINTLNPAVPVFWFTIISVVTHDFKNNVQDAILFFSGTFLVILTGNIIKILLAGKLKKFIYGKRIVVVNLITGLVFIGFGLFVILNNVPA